MALNGKTPAEMAGINLQLGQNKWESLIRQSFFNHRKQIKEVFLKTIVWRRVKRE